MTTPNHFWSAFPELLGGSTTSAIASYLSPTAGKWSPSGEGEIHASCGVLSRSLLYFLRLEFEACHNSGIDLGAVMWLPAPSCEPRRPCACVTLYPRWCGHPPAIHACRVLFGVCTSTCVRSMYALLARMFLTCILHAPFCKCNGRADSEVGKGQAEVACFRDTRVSWFANHVGR